MFKLKVHFQETFCGGWMVETKSVYKPTIAIIKTAMEQHNDHTVQPQRTVFQLWSWL